jgi:predicted site-specific integrase-resolvase
MRSYTVAEVADRFAVSEHVVLSWIKTGQIRALNCARSPAAKRPTWRIPESSIAEFEARRMPTAVVISPRKRRQKNDVIEFY